MLFAARPVAAAVHDGEPSLLRRLGAIAGAVFLVLFGWWVSLFATSEGLDDEQQVIVYRAVDLLEERGFSKEVFALRNVARFRSTDNWWNLYNGHYQAYAATNFPFEIVTIYDCAAPSLRRRPSGAALRAGGSPRARRRPAAGRRTRTWTLKERLGWTADVYGRSKVWKNTREWTQASAPDMFTCKEVEIDCTTVSLEAEQAESAE